MLGYYDGYDNGPAQPVVKNDEWATLVCKDCGVLQTHHRKEGSIKWRCVICQTLRDGGLANDKRTS